MEDNVITLSDAIKHNPMTTFRLTYKRMRYNCKYDRKQGHFYSYVGKKAIVMKPNMVSEVKIYSQSQYNGYKVNIDEVE